MSFSEEKGKSRGKVNSYMKKRKRKKKKKAGRKVSYPVDQLLPLSVKVLIAGHASVCVSRSVCARQGERKEEAPVACCVRTVRRCLYSLLILAHVNGGKKTTGLHFSPLLSCSVSGGHVLG